MVITYDPAGAKYSGPVMQDWWFRTIDYWNSQTSLTMGHSLANADGTYTVVVSPTDPGVYNWIGTGGLNEVLVVQRWQGLPKEHQGKGPTIKGQLVKLAALDSVLPQGMVKVTSDQRREQLELRRAAYNRRIVDN